MRALVAWSSGKDSAFALHEARNDVEIVGLLTTVTSTYGRVSMHGVREDLLDAQARALGLPLTKVQIPWPCPNEVYEAEMARAVAAAKVRGIEAIVFGDLFLSDIRAYREAQLKPTGLKPLFPLWERETDRLARQMVEAGLEAHLTCVDPRKLERSFAGRRFDSALLDALPKTIDPCGENGEFHTFVSGGPMFRQPVPVRRGEVVDRDGFVFADFALAC